MVDSKEGYKKAFKATSLFGGVQIITILIGILKSKFIALWLGPSGFGIISIFNSTISLVSSISNLGLSSSAVREISKANKLSDEGIKLSKTIKSINRCVIITGLCGSIFTICFSSMISKWVFNSTFYTHSFILLSIVILINALYSGHYATLQGVRMLKQMAQARIIGSLLGTIITLPLFYLFKEKGIVPSILLTSLVTFLISKYYASKITLPNVKITIKDSFLIGKQAINLGIMMAISNIAVYLVEFILKSFITKNGSLSDVGLYQAGWTLNAQYLGLVFTAMSTDYFPRLSSISDNNSLINSKVNEQAEIAILILSPMIVIMLIGMPILIRILYSRDFIEITSMTRWLMIGSLIKAGSWAVSYIFLAKGDGKSFLFNELGIKLITLPSYLIGYHLWGILGIGYAFTSNYIVYFIWVVLRAKGKYQFNYSESFYKLMFFQLLLSLITLFILGINNGLIKYLLLILVVVLALCYSFFELNKRIDFMYYIKTIKK